MKFNLFMLFTVFGALSVNALPRNIGLGKRVVSTALKARTYDTPLKAVVNLAGDSSVTGYLIFEQAGPDEPVAITAHIAGLDPSSLRGYHVHKSGNLTDGCTSASTHFNPFNLAHGAPTDDVRHVGDLGNIESDANGCADFIQWDHVISLEGERNIVGRAIVVHAGADDLGTGGDDESLKTGNAGARSACGVIGWA